MRNTIYFSFVLFVFSIHADDKWDRAPIARGDAVTAAPVAPQSITAGGCTATATPATGGANLTFTCPNTAWRLNIGHTSKGLQVRRALFRRNPSQSFMTILYEANIAEIFVPYHDADPGHRLYDTQYLTPTNGTRAITAEDVDGANAELVTMQGDTLPTAAMEIRDRGIAWLCKWGPVPQGGSRSRRGRELAVWSVLDTGNYEYLIEYTFRDDGQINFRLGATGYDNPNKDYAPGLAHMHDILWRVDLDLNGASGDSAFMTSHNEQTNSLGAYDLDLAFNGDKEGGIGYDPDLFTNLLIEDAGLNKRNRHFGYELVPAGAGLSRHAEEWTRKGDFFVTRYHQAEPAVPATWTTPDTYLIGNLQNQYGIFNAESVTKQDLVIWYRGQIHHEPHDEDQSETDLGNEYRGLTLTHWTGFDLVPHNLFDFNPLGAPDRVDCD